MKTNSCIDAGREGCPCALAEHGQCLVCSRLGGRQDNDKINGGSKDGCQDCSWQGTCIYTLYEQNGRRLIGSRSEKLMTIKEIRTYSEDLKVFVVEASKGFCQKAQTAGAYVFIRPQEEAGWYDAPISVLKAEPEKGLLHLGVCRCGSKSSAIFAEKEKLWVRGVYYNALSGLSTLKDDAEETMIYAKGIAVSPLRNFLDGGSRYTRWLKNMHIYIDLEKIGFDFFKDYFGDLPAGAIEVRNFAKEGLSSLDDLDHLEEAADANVFALTSPHYAKQVERAAGSGIVKPTEGNMCCGEGICGACTYVDQMGQTIRRCKVQR